MNRITSLLRPLVTASISIGLISVFASTPSASAVSTTRYVSASGSVGNGVSCSSPGYVGATQTSIQNAITAANPGDRVHICAGTYNISSRLVVSKNLTIKGDGVRTTILDGGGISQILIIRDPNIDDAVDTGSPTASDEILVSVSDLTFQNGYSAATMSECQNGEGCGGAIYIENESRFDVDNSYFKNNRAGFGGGAIGRLASGVNYPTVPSFISNSTFESNEAEFDGGAIGSYFGFGIVVERSTFVGNRINQRCGTTAAAIFSTMTINSSTILETTGPNGTAALCGGMTVNRSIISATAPTTVCDQSADVGGANGNIVTDSSCGITDVAPPSTAGNSSVSTVSALKLGAYSYRGYSIKTVPLLAGSTALNYYSGCAGSDQHGFTVPQGSSCDLGAYERPTTQSSNAPTGWTYASTDHYRGTTMAVSAGAVDPAGQGVDYRSETPSVCTISSVGTITALTIGTCEVSADAPGYLLRDAATVSKTFNILAATTTTSTTTTSTTSTTTPSVISPVTTLAQGQASVATIPAGGTSSTTVAQVNSNTVATSTPTTIAAPSTTVPSPDAPAASPGEAAALVDGQSVAAKLARENNALVITGAGVQATVYAVSADGSRIALDKDGNLRFSAGDSVVVEATGYTPGEKVEVWIYSTPTRLGFADVDATGTIRGTFRIPSSVPSGNHRVVLGGENKNGQEVVLGVGVALGEIDSSSTLARLLISIPVALAIIFGLVIPTTLRRRRRVVPA
jgi:hypothetical protein